MENAKKFALTTLDRVIDMIKLDGLTMGDFNRKELTGDELRRQIIELVVNKARGTAADDTGGNFSELFKVSMAETDHQLRLWRDVETATLLIKIRKAVDRLQRD